MASQVNPLSQHSQLISEHQAVDLRSPSPLFLPSPSYLEAFHATTQDPYQQQYSFSRGRVPLLGAVAGLYSRLLGRELDPRTEVLVSAGGEACMAEVLITFLNPGDEVILLEPTQPLLASQVLHAGGVPVPVPPSLAPGGQIDTHVLRKAFSSKTKMVCFSSPSLLNAKPHSLADLKTIADLCQEFDTLCVLDERFENLVFEGRGERICSLPGMWDRTISVHSGETLFGIPSMLVGWVIADGEFIGEIMKTHVLVTFHTPTPNQIALTRAICYELSAETDKGWLSEMRVRAKAAREEMFSLFKGAGLAPVLPAASHFMLLDVSSLIPPDSCPATEMARRGIGCLPASVFLSAQELAHSTVVVCFLQPRAVMEELSGKLALLSSAK